LTTTIAPYGLGRLTADLVAKIRSTVSWADLGVWPIDLPLPDVLGISPDTSVGHPRRLLLNLLLPGAYLV
jgi:hypothetical protein